MHTLFLPIYLYRIQHTLFLPSYLPYIAQVALYQAIYHRQHKFLFTKLSTVDSKSCYFTKLSTEDNVSSFLPRYLPQIANFLKLSTVNSTSCFLPIKLSTVDSASCFIKFQLLNLVYIVIVHFQMLIVWAVIHMSFKLFIQMLSAEFEIHQMTHTEKVHSIIMLQYFVCGK